MNASEVESDDVAFEDWEAEVDHIQQIDQSHPIE